MRYETKVIVEGKVVNTFHFESSTHAIDCAAVASEAPDTEATVAEVSDRSGGLEVIATYKKGKKVDAS